MDLLDPYVDILLAETLSTSFEVKAALAAARGRDKPLWVALTLERSRQRRFCAAEKR